MLWTALQGQPAAATILISDKDEEIAALHIAVGDWPAVERVVVIRPAGLPHAELIDAIVRLQDVEQACIAIPFNPTLLINALAPLSGEVYQLTEAACSLFLSLRRLDGTAVAHASSVLSFLQSRLNVLPGPTAKLLDKLTSFTCELGRDTLDAWIQPALFIHPNTDAKNKNWWKHKPSIADAFGKSAQRFNAVVNGQVPPSIKKVHVWLTKLAREATNLHLPIGTARTEADVFRTASAFMTANSDLHQREGRYVLGLLCLHRACEWLLAAWCADLTLLDFTFRDGLRLSANTTKPVTFDSMRDAVFNASTLLTTIDAQLISLNHWRNLLTYTHHMSAPSAAHANTLCTSLRAKLPALAGSDWRAAVEVLTAPIPLSLADLLDPLGDLRDSFVMYAAADMAAQVQ